MFEPTGSRPKRTSMLPQVRVDENELAAVRWLTSHLSASDGREYSMSDVIRLCVARVYEAEQQRAAKEGAPKRRKR